MTPEYLGFLGRKARKPPKKRGSPAAALDPTCRDHMMAYGGVVLNSPAHAHRAYPGMWPSAEAAKKALQREKSQTNPYKESFIGECLTPLRVTYQLAGPGKKQAEAMFDPAVVPDPAAWLGTRLGTLAQIEIHTPQPDLPVVEPVMTGEMMLASAVPPEAMPEPLADPPLPEPLMAGMPPAEIYPGAVLEPPPEMLLVVRGRDRVPIAIIEVPAMGPFMGARAVTPAEDPADQRIADLFAEPVA